MLAKISGALTCAMLIAGLSQPMLARDKSNTANPSTMTGCLANGTKSNEYAFKSEDGKTYGLKSSTVDLAQHVGHKVTVTGSLKMEKEKPAKASKNDIPGESGDMKVTELKMVSTTCQ
jgi:hypothetical protein